MGKKIEDINKIFEGIEVHINYLLNEQMDKTTVEDPTDEENKKKLFL